MFVVEKDKHICMYLLYTVCLRIYVGRYLYWEIAKKSSLIHRNFRNFTRNKIKRTNTESNPLINLPSRENSASNSVYWLPRLRQSLLFRWSG